MSKETLTRRQVLFGTAGLAGGLLLTGFGRGETKHLNQGNSGENRPVQKASHIPEPEGNIHKNPNGRIIVKNVTPLPTGTAEPTQAPSPTATEINTATVTPAITPTATEIPSGCPPGDNVCPPSS